MQIDARGLSGPVPLMRTSRALDEKPSRLTVLVTGVTAWTNVVTLLRAEGFDVDSWQHEGTWRIEARRSNAREN